MKEQIGFTRQVTIDEILTLLTLTTHSTNVHNTARALLGISDGRDPVDNSLCYLEKAPKQISDSLNTCVIVTNSDTASELSEFDLIVVEDPRAQYIDLLHSLSRNPGFTNSVIESKGQVKIHSDADVNCNAIIEDGAYIGAGSQIAAGCVIKTGVHIEENVIVREGTVIGCDGISLYKAKDGRLLKFPHFSGVVIHNNVEIGASCVIARGVLSSTTIGQGTVVGNLSNIGHSVIIEKNVWISSGCIVGGNTTINQNSTIGLGVRVKDNIKIGEGSSIGMGSAVVRSVGDGESVFGNPAKKFRKITAGPNR